MIRQKIIQYVLQLALVQLKLVAQQDKRLQLFFIIRYRVITECLVIVLPDDAVKVSFF